MAAILEAQSMTPELLFVTARTRRAHIVHHKKNRTYIRADWLNRFPTKTTLIFAHISMFPSLSGIIGCTCPSLRTERHRLFHPLQRCTQTSRISNAASQFLQLDQPIIQHLRSSCAKRKRTGVAYHESEIVSPKLIHHLCRAKQIAQLFFKRQVRRCLKTPIPDRSRLAFPDNLTPPDTCWLHSKYLWHRDRYHSHIRIDQQYYPQSSPQPIFGLFVSSLKSFQGLPFAKN
jgi:hypothetical protein